MLKQFDVYLKKSGQIKEKSIPYYVKWVADCYTFLNKHTSQIIHNEEKEKFLTYLSQFMKTGKLNKLI